ncbi:MAG: hypothetical protein L0241_14620 [Planctomycetia bacterium]|nr:hypothetical protein [Planctomycetia bacterium]
MKPSQLDVEVETVVVPCTAKDLRATFGWLLTEMRMVGELFRPEERALLRKIMAHTDGPLTVGDLFPKFQRESEEHRTLRRLRAAHFIRPVSTGRWELDEPIEPTPFGRLMWDQLGEERIFTPPPVKPKAKTIEQHTPPPKASSVTWDNLLECVRERQKRLASAQE